MLNVQGMKLFDTLPGKVVAMATHDGVLWAIYENPRSWWQFWRPAYGVRRYE